MKTQTYTKDLRFLSFIKNIKRSLFCFFQFQKDYNLQTFACNRQLKNRRRHLKLKLPLERKYFFTFPAPLKCAAAIIPDSVILIPFIVVPTLR